MSFKKVFFFFRGWKEKIGSIPAVWGNLVCIPPVKMDDWSLIDSGQWVACGRLVYIQIWFHTRKNDGSVLKVLISLSSPSDLRVKRVRNQCVYNLSCTSKIFFVCYEHCFNNIGAIFLDTPYFESLTLVLKLFLLYYLRFSKHNNCSRQSVCSVV